MHLIQSLKNEFSFDMPLFSKYPATSINSYFYKMTLFYILCINYEANDPFLLTYLLSYPQSRNTIISKKNDNSASKKATKTKSFIVKRSYLFGNSYRHKKM